MLNPPNGFKGDMMKELSKEELVNKIKMIDSVVDFFEFKPQILKALGYKEPKPIIKKKGGT